MRGASRTFVVLLLAWATAVSLASPATAKACEGFRVETGNYPKEFSGVRASGVRCKRARVVIKAVSRAEKCYPVDRRPRQCTIRGYSCTHSQTGTADYEGRCTKDKKRIRWERSDHLPTLRG